MVAGGCWRVANWKHALRAGAREKRRTLRQLIEGVLLVAVAITLVSVAVAAGLRQHRDPKDLLRGARWQTSSSYELYLAPKMFFHTEHESSPSITYSFERETTLSSLYIENTDDLRERAVPLVAELSADGGTFEEVARIESAFAGWRPQFAPRTTRYLRLRALKQTWLHLKHVEAYR